MQAMHTLLFSALGHRVNFIVQCRSTEVMLSSYWDINRLAAVFIGFACGSVHPEKPLTPLL